MRTVLVLSLALALALISADPAHAQGAAGSLWKELQSE